MSRRYRGVFTVTSDIPWSTYSIRQALVHLPNPPDRPLCTQRVYQTGHSLLIVNIIPLPNHCICQVYHGPFTTFTRNTMVQLQNPPTRPLSTHRPWFNHHIHQTDHGSLHNRPQSSHSICQVDHGALTVSNVPPTVCTLV